MGELKTKPLLRMIAACGFLGVAMDGHAAPVLDFGIVAPTPGVISYAGGSSALVGTGIQVDNLLGAGTVLHDGFVSQCLGCVVEFSTGAFDSYDAVNNEWMFTGGGTITLIGGMDFADNSVVSDIPTGTTLMTGSFNEAIVKKLSSGYFDFRIAAGSFTDTKNADLLAYYGLPQQATYEGGLNLSFSGAPTAGENAFTSTTLFSGDIVNTPVPVPAALWLMGTALLGMGGFARRK